MMMALILHSSFLSTTMTQILLRVPESIKRIFNTYDKSALRNNEGDWFIRDRKLNVYAAIDFAFSLRKQVLIILL